MEFAWLGVAGLSFTLDGATMLVDPFFSRPSKLDLLLGRRVSADAGLCAERAPRADFLLITHPHYDHLLDAPEILRRTGARAYGTPNTCRLLELHGVPAQQVRPAAPGDCLSLGPFKVEVFPAEHTRTPFDRWINGPLPGSLRPPLRLTDYRMDACLGFRIWAGERAALVGCHPVPADTLFAAPFRTRAKMAEILRSVGPGRFVPIHWEDFTLPLNQPPAPMFLPPHLTFPRLRRIDLRGFARDAAEDRPGLDVLLPELFATYPVFAPARGGE